MTQFKAIKPNVEVNGQTVLSVANALGAMKDTGLRFLREANLNDVKENGWYSQQDWLNAFEKIANKIGNTTLKVIGASIPDNARFPPEINDIHKALAAIDVAYHMNHRIGGKVMFDPSTGILLEGIGHYRYTRVSDREAHIRCDNPYPCAFDRGLIEKMAKRFKPAATATVKVEHDESKCRAKGGESCLYRVTW
ncbi:MAG: hypothetical protein P4L83_22735 [Nevskia sp.]|nr:hypothetical protein [Nevskia sp.]